ncbi:MAG: site-2 protease family protein [Candidatus Nomurabacteria bacterium]|jgi:Zn-dependent protease|nr:site-2 protease family protein [Candidatus Nomurabacteria bacterium]
MDITYLFIVLIVTTTSMVLHEFMHGLVAYWLGDDTAKANGRLTLNPLKHLDPFMSVLLPLLLAISGGPVFGGAKPVPIDTRNLKYKEWGFALVAIAGPVTNILLAFIGFLVGHFTGLFYNPVPFWSTFVQAWMFINMGFAIFNMIPIPPLDGSRVLYAIAPDFLRNIMAQMERWGIMIVLVLVMIFGTAFSSFMSGAMDAILKVFYWIVGVYI